MTPPQEGVIGPLKRRLYDLRSVTGVVGARISTSPATSGLMLLFPKDKSVFASPCIMDESL